MGDGLKRAKAAAKASRVHYRFGINKTPGELNREEIAKLHNFMDWQETVLFERCYRGQWQELNLAGILELYNLSSEYDGIASWRAEEKGAEGKYKALLKRNEFFRNMD